MTALNRGDAVSVRYSGYTIDATVIDPDCGPGPNWVMVRQDSDYPDVPEADRPTFEAAREYVWRPGIDPMPPSPDTALALAAYGIFFRGDR